MKPRSAILAGFVLAGTIGAVCGTLIGTPAHSQTQPAGQVGRFVKLGITPASPAWRANNFADTSIIWSMDSTSGMILGCGDVSGNCTSISGSGSRR